MQKRSRRSKIISILFVAVCLVVAMFPVYWMLNTSFKGQAEIYQKVPTFFPQRFTLEGYDYLVSKTPFLTGIKNSFIIAMVVSLFSIFISYPAAYAVARLRFRGRSLLSRCILFGYLVPTSVLYIPLFMLVSKVGLSNTITGLMLIYPTFTLPYAAWMLIPYIRSIPYDIEEAAIVDGCNRIGSMYKIVFPLAIPGIVSTFIFTFALCWGEYLYSLVNINSTEMKTFPVIISNLIYGDIYPWGQIMAGGILAGIPILVVYMLASNFLVGGTTAGGVKQ